MENKRKLYSLSFIIVLLVSACLVFTPQASAAPTWQTEEVTTAGNRQTSMAIDSSGTIHVIYVKDTDLDGYDDLNYIQKNAVGWSIPRTVASHLTHYGNSIAIDFVGNVYMIYEQGGDEKCAKRDTTGAWTYTTIDTQGNRFGSYNSIAIGSNNVPQVIYHDYFDGGYPEEDILKYAVLSGDSWDVYKVDIQRYVGEYCSIAVDSNNKPHISYRDYGNAALLYAKLISLSIYGENSDWEVEEVEDYPVAAGSTGYDTSIALDSTNIPFISYYDDQAAALEVRDRTGGMWNFATADSGDFACTDIAINKATNAKHISYYDVTNGNLKYATNAGGTWISTTADPSTNNVGTYTSLALDSSGSPHITYIDVTNEKLKHAWLAESAPAPIGTSLTVQYSPGTLNKLAGETATISGKLTVSGTGAGIGAATIHLSYMGQSHFASGNIADVVTEPDGTYSYDWTPSADLTNDNYQITARYSGEPGIYNPTTKMTFPPGLFVVPEYTFGALLAIIAMFAAYVVAKKGFSGLVTGLRRR